jgi:hypothetical protein
MADATPERKVVIMHPKEFGELGAALGQVETMISNAKEFTQGVSNDEGSNHELQYNNVTIVEAKA